MSAGAPRWQHSKDSTAASRAVVKLEIANNVQIAKGKSDG